MRVLRFTILCLLCLTAIQLSSCGMSGGIKLGQAAADQFHSRYNEQQYDAIYDSADPAYLKAVDRDTSKQYFQMVHEKLGPCSNYKNTGFNYDVSTTGTFIDLQYSGTCASGTIEEDFHWKEVGGKAVLIHYTAKSPALMGH
jgi:hypothetical protein